MAGVVDPYALEPGEQEVHAQVANLTTGPYRAAGGKLIVTDRRVIFRPHGVDRAVDGAVGRGPTVFARDEVVGVRILPRDMAGVFNGGLRKRLGLDLRSGETLGFVVNRTQKSADHLADLLSVPRTEGSPPS